MFWERVSYSLDYMTSPCTEEEDLEFWSSCLHSQTLGWQACSTTPALRGAEDGTQGLVHTRLYKWLYPQLPEARCNRIHQWLVRGKQQLDENWHLITKGQRNTEREGQRKEKRESERDRQLLPQRNGRKEKRKSGWNLSFKRTCRHVIHVGMMQGTEYDMYQVAEG